jgi:hypothetical protein
MRIAAIAALALLVAVGYSRLGGSIEEDVKAHGNAGANHPATTISRATDFASTSL